MASLSMRLLIGLGDCSKYSDFICKPSTPKTFAPNMKKKHLPMLPIQIIVQIIVMRFT